MIPEGWREATAEELCSRISVGIVIKPTQYYVDEGQGVRAFRSANIGEGFVRDSDWIHISHDGHAKNKKSALKANDLLIVRTGYPGTACLLPPEYEGSNCIDIIFARPDPEQVVPAYLCTFTNSEYGKKQVLDGSGGLAQQHFNVGAYKKLKLPLPPLFEQKRIAETLETWDRAIETIEALIANARAQKQALMQQLLPQGTTPPKKRLPGFSGEWRETSLAELLSVKRAKGKIVPTNDDGDGVPYIGSTSFLGEFSNYTTSNDALLCVETDILVLWDGEYAGKVATGLTGAVSSTVGRYRLAKAKADPVFVVSLMEKESERIRSIREGSGIPHMPGDFEHWFKFALPALEEQQAIAEVFKANRVIADELQSQLTALRQEKAALMQQLLTGKRRVNLPESEVA